MLSTPPVKTPNALIVFRLKSLYSAVLANNTRTITNLIGFNAIFSSVMEVN